MSRSITHAVALFDFRSDEDGQLSLDEGDPIELEDTTDHGGWIAGMNMRSHRRGWFPRDYIQILRHATPSSSELRRPSRLDVASPVRSALRSPLSNTAPVRFSSPGESLLSPRQKTVSFAKTSFPSPAALLPAAATAAAPATTARFDYSLPPFQSSVLSVRRDCAQQQQQQPTSTRHRAAGYRQHHHDRQQ